MLFLIWNLYGKDFANNWEFVGHEKITGRSPLWFSILPLMVVADRDQETLLFLL